MSFSIFLYGLSEVFFTYSILLFTILNPFLTTNTLVVINVLIFLASLVGMAINYINHQVSIWMTLEPIKNSILLFARTLLPFYVFLIVFRYEIMYQQVIASIGISIVALLLGRFITTKTKGIWTTIKLMLSANVTTVKVILAVVAIVSIGIITQINYPSSFARTFNLQNYVLRSDNLNISGDISNDVRLNELSDELYTDDNSTYDKYEDDDYLYIATMDYVSVTDKSTSITTQLVYEGVDHELLRDRKGKYYGLININDSIYVTSRYGILEVNVYLGLVGYTSVEDSYGEIFINEGKKYLLVESLIDGYVNYVTVNEEGVEVVLPETPEYYVTNNNLLFVEQGTLLKIQDGTIYMYFNSDISYPNYETFIGYDSKTDVIFTVTPIVRTSLYDKREMLLKSYNTYGNLHSVRLEDNQNSLYLVEQKIYFIQDNSYIVVFDEELNEESFLVVPQHMQFLNNVDRKYNTVIENIELEDGEIIMYNRYTVIEDGERVLKMNIYTMNQTNLELDLNMYSYFGFNTLILLIVMMLIPMSDYNCVLFFTKSTMDVDEIGY